ncbi:hypothetical protein ABFS83_03G025500 [Erythranthe nasuta]
MFCSQYDIPRPSTVALDCVDPQDYLLTKREDSLFSRPTSQAVNTLFLWLKGSAVVPFLPSTCLQSNYWEPLLYVSFLCLSSLNDNLFGQVFRSSFNDSTFSSRLRATYPPLSK